jgi:hypothetical protein
MTLTTRIATVWAGCRLQVSHVENAHFWYVLYMWTKLFNKILYRFEYYIIASPSNVNNGGNQKMMTSTFAYVEQHLEHVVIGITPSRAS